MAKVRETMTRDVVSVKPSATIIEVAQKMRDYGTGFIPVCENGKFRGMVRERDIITHIVATAQDPKSERATSVMHRTPTVSPGEDSIQAAKVMTSDNLRVLPVVAHSGRLLGLLSLDDLAQESLALAANVLVKTAERS